MFCMPPLRGYYVRDFGCYKHAVPMGLWHFYQNKFHSALLATTKIANTNILKITSLKTNHLLVKVIGVFNLTYLQIHFNKNVTTFLKVTYM
jgi:hypothetical protein